MDYIRLERVQPFSQNHDSTTQQEKDSQLGTHSLITPNDSPIIDTRSTFSSNQEKLIDPLPPIIIDMKQLKASFASKQHNINKLCRKTVRPVQLPQDVIPIYTNKFEVVEYERFFDHDPFAFEELTIADLLAPFSFPRKMSKAVMTGKVLFVQRFLQKMSRLSVNYDFAITCMSEQYELELFNLLSDALVHFTTSEGREDEPATARIRISEFAPLKNIYGIIYKHRKQAKDMNLTFKPALDLVLVYDSACRVGDERIFDLFAGTHTPKPFVLYLCDNDTIDARLHRYNSLQPMNVIDWNTKVAELSFQQRNDILLQPNRHVRVQLHVTSWIDFTSQCVINWINSKSKKMYTFTYPTKKKLLKIIESFPNHHPVRTIPRKDIQFISRPNSHLQSPPTEPRNMKRLSPVGSLMVSTQKRKISPPPPPPSNKKKVSSPPPASNKKKVSSPPPPSNKKKTSPPQYTSVRFTEPYPRNTPNTPTPDRGIKRNNNEIQQQGNPNKKLATASSSKKIIHNTNNNNLKRSRNEDDVSTRDNKKIREMTGNDYIPHLPSSNPFPASGNWIPYTPSGSSKNKMKCISSSSSSNIYETSTIDNVASSSSSSNTVGSSSSFSNNVTSSSSSSNNVESSTPVYIIDNITSSSSSSHFVESSSSSSNPVESLHSSSNVVESSSSSSNPVKSSNSSSNPVTSSSSSSNTVESSMSSNSDQSLVVQTSVSSDNDCGSITAELNNNLNNLLRQFELEMDAMIAKF